ncbi:MAG: hypothetical protein JNM72_22100 [Deltaproteobacteria bacterium]|nr:hypothetical protein [Deltaproteobacteria bacterium]
MLPAPRRRDRPALLRALIGALLVVLIGVASAAPRPEAGLAAWAPQAPPGMAGDSAACGACHSRTHRDWSASAHATSWSDPRFQASWRAWPNGWCLNCHLPLEAQQREVLGGRAIPGALHSGAGAGGPWAAEGVGCLVCHGGEGVLRAAGRPSALARRAHPIEADPALQVDGAAGLCARCHQFNFQQHSPRHPFALSATPLQDTVAEWRGSAAAAAGIGCADCHIPDGRHRFAGGHDLGLLAAAAEVSAWATAGEATVELRAIGVGHRLPTGDPFRRLIVHLCADASPSRGQRGPPSPCAAPLAALSFRRTFVGTDVAWALDEDTTAPPAAPGQPAVRRLSTPVAQQPARWVLEVVWVDLETAAQLPPTAARALVEGGPVRSGPPPAPRR